MRFDGLQARRRLNLFGRKLCELFLQADEGSLIQKGYLFPNFPTNIGDTGLMSTRSFGQVLIVKTRILLQEGQELYVLLGQVFLDILE